MFWIIIFSFVVLIALAIAIYLLPEQTAKAKKKKEKKAMLMAAAGVVDTSKDWKAIAERWEKHNQSLQGAIEKMNMDQKNVQLQIDGHKAQIKDMGEKLALEKSWREKEQMSLEKLKAHEKDFQSQISRTESELEKEHSHRMRLEREYQELKIKYDQIVEEKRQLSIKAASQQTTLEADAREIKELKFENTQLKEKRADIQWVAKSEFDELKKLLQAKEKDLARLKESHG
jgi:chromosome segregation ATPase